MYYRSRQKCWHRLYVCKNLYSQKLNIDSISTKTQKFNTKKIYTLTVVAKAVVGD